MKSPREIAIVRAATRITGEALVAAMTATRAASATTSGSRCTMSAATFEPGRIFTIEPQFRLEEEHLGIRLEDMILITETGVEVMSGHVPITVADVERTMRNGRLQ